MPRIIKKYANRRLYDTGISRYITLDDLKKLITGGIQVTICEARTGKDISREVLLQLVAEQESLGQPILNQTTLVALIRFYDHPMQKLASDYLETALHQLDDQRAILNEQMQALIESPVELLSQLTRKNMEWMHQLQKAVTATVSPVRPGDPNPNPNPNPKHQQEKKTP